MFSFLQDPAPSITISTSLQFVFSVSSLTLKQIDAPQSSKISFNHLLDILFDIHNSTSH